MFKAVNEPDPLPTPQYKTIEDWREEVLGTSRDIDSVSVIESSPSHVRYKFLAAWAAPCDWFRYLAQQFKEFMFLLFWDDCSMGGAGVMIAANGEIKECDINYPGV